MPANKYALVRYRVIDRCLNDKSKPLPSREDFREACEEALYGSGGGRVSLSTIDKDISAMKNESELGYDAPIVYNRELKGYYYSEEGYSIGQLSLGEEDLEALRFAAAILKQFRDMPILDQYQNAVDKITNRLTISPNPEDDQLDRYIQFERSTVSGGNEYLGPLLSAIQSQTVCELKYRGFRDDRIKDYVIHGLLLKEYSNRWYLIAHVPSRGGRLTFGLERIVAIQATEERFERPVDFDSDRFFRYSVGITESREAPVIVRLRCAPVAGKLLRTQPIHPSQKVVKEDAEGIEIELKVIPTPELESLILSFGSQVKVISPPDLTQKIRSEWQNALNSVQN